MDILLSSIPLARAATSANGESGMGSDHYDLSAYPLFRSVLGAKPQDAKPKHCLVIDPSDDASNDVRLHADTLWKYVIQPALLDTAYEAHRSAGISHMIDQPVVDSLLDADLVIAILSHGNPRVFYETALAQAAARPLILMIEEGREIAFEPRHAKVVTYRLDTESVVSAVNVSRLQAVVGEIENAGAPACHGFRPGTAALGGGCEDRVTVYERSPKFSYDRRLEMIREADTRIDIMGIANLALALHPDTAETLRGRGEAVEIRILQCAPANTGLVSLLGARSDELGAILRKIEQAAEAWRRIAETPGLDLSLSIRRAQASLPIASALITDRAVVATPYMRSRSTSESPTLHAKADDAYHAAMSAEFNLLWGEAAPIFRAERSASNGYPRTHAVNGRAAEKATAYWAHKAPAAKAPAPTEISPVVEAPSLENISNENAPDGAVHFRLFGSPDKNDASAGESAGVNAPPKPKAMTINERGHAIIRSVC